MSKAISNTSPLLYLYRIGAIDWLGKLFEEIWIPAAVEQELRKGKNLGYDVPLVANYSWIRKVNPTTVPSEWLVLDLGPGELECMALSLEFPEHILLLDDLLARRVAKAAGLTVWGTLKLLLEVKQQGFVKSIAPNIERLTDAGMWLSSDIKKRILKLAGES